MLEGVQHHLEESREREEADQLEREHCDVEDAAAARVAGVDGAWVSIVADRELLAGAGLWHALGAEADAVTLALHRLVGALACVEVTTIDGAWVAVVALLGLPTAALPVVTRVSHRAEIPVLARAFHILVGAAAGRITAVIGAGIVVFNGKGTDAGVGACVGPVVGAFVDVSSAQNWNQLFSSGGLVPGVRQKYFHKKLPEQLQAIIAFNPPTVNHPKRSQRTNQPMENTKK